jgi:hypothetical protein
MPFGKVEWEEAWTFRIETDSGRSEKATGGSPLVLARRVALLW